MSGETDQVVPSNGNNGAGGDTLSRQPSYLSLSSGKSVYMTASEFSTDDDEFETCDSSFQGSYSSEEISETSSTAGEETESSSLRGPEEDDMADSGVSEHVLTPASVQRLQNSLSKQAAMAPADLETSSSTLEEEEISKQSIISSNGDEGEDWEEDVDERDGEEDEEAGSEGMVEIQEDVLKLCNDIAEAQQPDFQKQAEIERACFENIRELRSLAISEAGLLSNQLRKRSWPLLLGIPLMDVEDQQNYRIPKYFPNVDDKIRDLVQLDVNRVLKRFPPNLSDTQQDHIQTYLINLILAVLDGNPQAHYYQGFHDICLTFLLVCLSQNVPYIAYMSLNKMVRTVLAPFMERTMEVTNEIIHVVFSILEKEDRALYHKIVVESKCPAAFCLPWVITWFSHTLPNDTDVFRLSDFILGCGDQLDPPFLIPVFLSAALVLRHSQEIKENVTDTDIATMHHTLAQLPLHQTSLEPWLKDTLKLIRKYAGKEKQLMARAIKIKEYQNSLWNDESPVARRRASARNANVLAVVGRFVFIRHRWLTLAVIALGAAYVAQRYGAGTYINNVLAPFMSRFENFFGRRLPWQ